MNYLRVCAIGFLISTSFCGCVQDEISKHLTKLRKENFRIYLNGWTIKNHVLTPDLEYFSLSKIERDTFYKCVFNHFPKVDKYKVDLFAMSYVENGVYHEMSLQNNDTLYYFTCNKNINALKDGDFIKMKEKDFELGWYYYLYTHGKFNLKQAEFFEQNRDSLIQLKGSNLPILP